MPNNPNHPKLANLLSIRILTPNLINNLYLKFLIFESIDFYIKKD